MAAALRQLRPGVPGGWLRWVPALTIGVFLAPVGAGLLGIAALNRLLRLLIGLEGP